MASEAKPKALYIGSSKIRDALVRRRPSWDFAPAVATIEDFWNGFLDGSIDSDIQVILISDRFFDPTGANDAFEKFLVYMAPHCFLGVVNYKPNLNDRINDRIKSQAYASGNDGETLLYYFINPKQVNLTLDAGLRSFIDHSPAEEAVAILTGRTSAADRQALVAEREAAEAAEEEARRQEIAESPYLGQVVSCTSSKGGSGKSTVTLTLGTFLGHSSANSVREGLEERPLKVVILDCDVRDGQLGFITGYTNPSIIKLRLEGISEESINNTVIHSPDLKVDLLLAPKRPRAIEDTPPEFYVELIQQLRKMYDYVILDTSVNYLDPLLEQVAYPMSDQIVFVTDIVINSVFSMTRWIQEVTKTKEQGGMGIDRGKIGVVVNKTLANINMPGEKIQKAALGIPMITAIPSNPKLVAHAINMQSTQVLLKNQDLYVAFRRLALRLVGDKYKLSPNVNP